MSITRRRFLGSSLAGAALATPLAGALAACARGARPDGAGVSATFRHGVASGDPLADRVILWTRVTPARDVGAIAVRWAIARDPAMRDLAARGDTSTDAARDFTVKLDATGLVPATTYYYRFESLGDASPVGRTRTLPAGPVEHLRLAAFSCANVAWGRFHAYRLAAARSDLDLVLHLGDYLYEHANGTYGDGRALGRVPEPDRECTTLGDYRTRHAQYKRDPDLQALHRVHPMIAVWDDHEIANDAFRDGAENHQPESEGDWPARRAAAVRAYLDWMPVRETPAIAGGCLQRSFRLGDLAHLVMLDTRLCGRDAKVSARDAAKLREPSRSILGRSQEEWLMRELEVAQRQRVPWKLVGQQVMMAQLVGPDGAIRNPDQWDGYPMSRERLLDAIERARASGVLVLSGDIHSSWANDLVRAPFGPSRYDPSTGEGVLGNEIVTPAVSSRGLLEAGEAATRASAVQATHAHVRGCELHRRGYVVLDLTRERAQADWMWTSDPEEPEAREEPGMRFATDGAFHPWQPV